MQRKHIENHRDTHFPSGIKNARLLSDLNGRKPLRRGAGRFADGVNSIIRRRDVTSAPKIIPSGPDG